MTVERKGASVCTLTTAPNLEEAQRPPVTCPHRGQGWELCC